jgi:C1A family cysteine protease
MFNILKAFILVAGLAQVACFSYNDRRIVEKFENWISKFNIYSENEGHYQRLFDNWLENDKYIDLINNKNLTYTLDHNQYSGMNTEEFSTYMGFVDNKNILQKGNPLLRGSDIINQVDTDYSQNAQSIDWRDKHVVSPIRDQGQCGSCWAFSGTSTVESAVAIKTGELYDLSEQESVDCSTLKNGYTNMGCNGGMYDTMWKYVKANGGICSEDSYPYTSGTTKKTGTCQKTCTPIEETKVSNYVTVKTGSDDALMSALNIEPVSIAIEADTKSFQLYKSGVYTDYEGCGTTLDHAVVLVGYGSCSDGDYYILRNSWGTGWGENGYMRIGRGSQYGTSGMCGLLQDPMYPVV